MQQLYTGVAPKLSLYTGSKGPNLNSFTEDSSLLGCEGVTERVAPAILKDCNDCILRVQQ